jgi:hypothetical protein
MDGRIVPLEGTKQPMNALAYSDDTRMIARLLEDREASRLGKLEPARKVIARRAGCAPGTLESLRKGRLKRIERWLHDKLEALLVRELEAEIQRLTHELEKARTARSSDPDAQKLARLADVVAQAQRLMEGRKP